MNPLVHVEAALYLIGFFLANTAWQSLRSRRTALMLRQVRLRTVGQAVLMLLAILVSAAALHDLHPVLGWSWLQATGLEGASLVTAQGLPAATPDYSPSPILWIAPIAFPLLLLAAMPRLVWAEERWFRRGAEQRRPLGRVGGPVLFGLAHLLVGVPLFAALALVVAGICLQRAYLRQYALSGGSRLHAMRASAGLHLIYNLLILGVVALAIALRATR